MTLFDQARRPCPAISPDDMCVHLVRRHSRQPSAIASRKGSANSQAVRQKHRGNLGIPGPYALIMAPRNGQRSPKPSPPTAFA